tara:strand:+ start:56960 stop:57631 length:672 start_codon:yes stop_codon:yes gene_type:complete
LIWFFISVVVFLAGHIIPGLMRNQIVGWMGQRAYVVCFSVLSLVLLVWVIHEVLVADFIPLWPFAPWQVYVALCLMLPACILWAATILQPCPLSIGRKNGFDPNRPGINAFCRHPLLLGAFLWGLGHVLPNGDLVAVIFFGGSAVFALVGFARMEKIRMKEMSKAEISEILAGTRRFAPRAVLHGAIGLGEIGLGVMIYACLIIAHRYVIGISPLGALGAFGG